MKRTEVICYCSTDYADYAEMRDQNTYKGQSADYADYAEMRDQKTYKIIGAAFEVQSTDYADYADYTDKL